MSEKVMTLPNILSDTAKKLFQPIVCYQQALDGYVITLSYMLFRDVD